MSADFSKNLTVRMKTKKTDIAHRVKQLYAGISWVSAFTRIRFWTGSFTQIERYVPGTGTVVDLGCGYGIFANYLALSGPKRRVLGIDMDNDKISFADRGVPNAKFRVGDATKMRIRNLKAIILLDVLHHLHSYADQEQLIQKSKRLLSRGGKLIITEVDNKPTWKLILAYLADLFLYKGQPVYYGYRSRLFPILKSIFGPQQVKVIVLIHNPFPHLLYICDKV